MTMNMKTMAELTGKNKKKGDLCEADVYLSQ